jgi:hypothetical protein
MCCITSKKKVNWMMITGKKMLKKKTGWIRISLSPIGLHYIGGGRSPAGETWPEK